MWLEFIKDVLLGVIIFDLALVALVYWQDKELFRKIMTNVRSRLRI